MDKNNLKIITSYLYQASAILQELPIDRIAKVVKVLGDAGDNGNNIFIFGNGGSAATASHFACDLAKGAISNGKTRLKAFSLTDNTPLLSAWANDSAYENVFAEQLENFIKAGDIALGISGSGNSANVLNGVRVANAKGATTIGFIGFDGGKLKELVDIAVVAPCHNMEHAEDVHLLLGHIITICLREALPSEHILVSVLGEAI